VLVTTRAGFEPRPLFAPLKLFRANYYLGRQLPVSVTAIQSVRGLFQNNKKERAFERSCPLSQEGALSPIFEGDTPP
jgi:hypothetical protein